MVLDDSIIATVLSHYYLFLLYAHVTRIFHSLSPFSPKVILKSSFKSVYLSYENVSSSAGKFIVKLFLLTSTIIIIINSDEKEHPLAG